MASVMKVDLPLALMPGRVVAEAAAAAAVLAVCAADSALSE